MFDNTDWYMENPSISKSDESESFKKILANVAPKLKIPTNFSAIRLMAHDSCYTYDPEKFNRLDDNDLEVIKDFWFDELIVTFDEYMIKTIYRDLDGWECDSEKYGPMGRITDEIQVICIYKNGKCIDIFSKEPCQEDYDHYDYEDYSSEEYTNLCIQNVCTHIEKMKIPARIKFLSKFLCAKTFGEDYLSIPEMFALMKKNDN